MSEPDDVDVILHDCLFAVGQSIGTSKPLDFEAVLWLRTTYRDKFLCAILQNGNSWTQDRDRVTAVSRYLGYRALHHSEGKTTIDLQSIRNACADIEQSCQMNAEVERRQAR